MKKLKLLFVAAVLTLGVGTANAQVYIETDLTSQFNSLATTQWAGSSGQVTWAAPQVTTNSGLTVAAWERYNGSCDWTGDIMYTTVTGLVAGTYKIELYGAAAFTYGRGFGSTAFTGDLSKATSDTYTDNQSINENTGVTLYATTSEGTVSEEIPIYYATNFNTSGIATATLNNVVVGNNGEIKIGLSKTSTSTNWHVVQLKGVTATVDAEAVFAALKTQAEGLYSSPMNTTVLNELKAAANVDLTSAGADEYKAAIETLTSKTSIAQQCITNYAKAKEYFDEVENVLTTTNFYTAASYATYYAEPKAKYEANTLTSEEASALVKTSTGNRVANTLDDILLSTWTIGGEQAKDYTKGLYINTWSTEGNSDGSEFRTPFFEYWVSSGSLAATTIQGELAGLTPNQLYKVDVWARLQESGGFADNGITLQVGEGTTVDLTKAAQIGSTNRYADVFTASGTADADGKLTVKIVVAENSGCSWLSFKDVKYAELEDERIPLANQLATAVAEAKSLSTTLVIPAAAKTVLFNVADKYQDFTYTSLETAAKFTAAITEVNSAIATAQSMVVPYAAWKALKSQADALVAVSTNDTEENATLASAISAQNTNVEAATTAEAISSATTTLKGTMVTYVTTAQPINDECFDLTFMIVNPHFTEGDAVNPTGWTATYPEAPQGQWGGARELRLSTHNFEAYHKQFTLSQTIANLKKGTYKVTLQGFARHDDVNVTDKTNLFCGPVSQTIKEISEEYSTTSLISGKPAMGDNNGEAEKDGKYRPNGMSASYYYFQEINPATSQPFYTSEVQTLMKEDGNLTIGFKCETWSDWVIWDNFHLYYYGSAIAVTIDENVAGSVYDDDIENANITLKRTFSAGNWNTIALPFDLSDAETKAAFGSDAVVATCTETANGNNSDIAFNKAANAAITANTPVLLKTSTSESTFTFNGKTIKAGEAKSEGTNFDFVGTYAATTTIAEGDYFIGSNQLWKSAGATTIKGTRAYLKAKTAGARIANFLIDGDETTGIQTVNAKAQKSEKLYNMNGQEVKKAAKGLYIKNGKKMVVK